jgi:hypothetical protein
VEAKWSLRYAMNLYTKCGLILVFGQLIGRLNCCTRISLPRLPVTCLAVLTLDLLVPVLSTRPSIMYNGYRVIPGGKAAGAWR